MVALVSFLASSAIPVYRSVQALNDLDTASSLLAQSLRVAQIFSQSVRGDVAWGVHLEAGRIIVFKGSSFALRDSNFDEVFEISKGLNLSGSSEIVFSKLSGLPDAEGIFVLESAYDKKTVSVNSYGAVDW